jgi:hypothetical protein
LLKDQEAGLAGFLFTGENIYPQFSAVHRNFPAAGQKALVTIASTQQF